MSMPPLPFGSIKRVAICFSSGDSGVVQTGASQPGRRHRVSDNRWGRETHFTALALLSLELPLMSKATAKSIFTCTRDLDAFLGMYLTERQTHGDGAFPPRDSALQPSAKTSQPQRQTNLRDWASSDSVGMPPARDAHGAGASQPSASQPSASALQPSGKTSQPQRHTHL